MDSHQSHHLRLHHLLALRTTVQLLRLIAMLTLLLAISEAFAVQPVASSSWVASRSGKSYADPDVGLAAEMALWDASNAGYVACRIWTPVKWVNATQMSNGASLSGCAGGGLDVHANWNACPPNSTKVGNSCVCTAPYFDSADGKSCKVEEKSRWEKACEQSTGKRFDLSMPGRSAKGGCLNEINRADSPIDGDTGGLPDAFGCAMRLVEDGNNISAKGQDGVWWTTGEFRVTGGTCVATGTGGIPNDAPPGTEEGEAGKPTLCPEGRVVGINGVLACADNDPKGGIEGTDTGKITNPDGTSVETKKETKCDGGRCVTETTETKRDVNGLVIGTGTKKEEQSIKELCSKEPGNKVCASVGMGNGEGGGGFSGDCKAGFSAKGDDPVVNAMALEQHTRNCKLFGVDEDPQSTVNKALSGEDGQNTDKMKSDAAGTPITINTFDSGGRGWGRSCPPDPAIALPFAGGRTFSVPFSKICMPLSILAQAGVALTLLASFAWVMGGKS